MVHPPAPPELLEGDVLLADEPGRCGRGIDSHSYHFRLVKDRFNACFLLVKHGGGAERIRFGRLATINAFVMTANQDRYWVLQAAYHAISDARQQATEAVANYWRQAAAEKRIKTRRLRRDGTVRVSIMPARTLVATD